MPSSARPLAPSGRGSMTATSMADKMADNPSKMTDIQINKTTGWGNKFPNHSTPFKKRCMWEVLPA